MPSRRAFFCIFKKLSLRGAGSSGNAIRLVTANAVLSEQLEEFSPEQGKTWRQQAKELHRALRHWHLPVSPDWRQARALAGTAWAGVALELKAKIDYVLFRVGRPTHIDLGTPIELLDMHAAFKVSPGSKVELETPTRWYA